MELTIPGFLNRKFTDAQRAAAWKRYKAPKHTEKEPTREDLYWADYERRKLEGRQKDIEAARALQIAIEHPPEKQKEPKPPKGSSKRAEMRKGLLGIKALAKELGIHPRVARTALRKAKFPKPEWGWAFTEEQTGPVRKVIAAHLKAEAKKKPKKKAKRGK